MILFQEDWDKYPHAIVHYNTRNRTAVELALKLRMMGVENHLFFLALHDKDLEFVDPHDPNLSIEMMAKVGIECKINPWYFFREVARVPAVAGTAASIVRINRSNVALWWCFFCHIYIILTQPRQTGKSFNADLLMTELMNFLCNNTQINLMTKDDKLRGDNIKRLKDIYEELPAYLKFKTKEDANNTEEISIKALGNTYKTHVPQASPKRAYNLGRGMTTPIFQIDEAPFQPNIEIAMGSALMAMGAAIDAAKANNEPYGVILTTTAGKMDDKDGAFVYDLVQKSAPWTEKFYDCKNQEELEKTVRRHAPGGAFRVYACFSYKQLGKDDAWARDQLERASLSGDDANRDLFNIWTSGSQSSPLPTAILEAMRNSILDVALDKIYTIGGYMVRWYIDEEELEHVMRTRSVIAGMDTSDASGGDDIGLVFTDAETGAVLGAANFNETNLITFSSWLVWLLVNYEKVTLIPERRSTGSTIIDYLLLQLPGYGVDPFKRIFNWVINNPYEHKERFAEASLPMNRRPEDLYVRCKKYFGFSTSGTGQTARSELYSTTLQDAARRFSTRVHDRTLVSQISGLIKKNGRVDHAPGSHDDMVISWLLSHWMLTKAMNLQHYGINPRSVLTVVDTKQELSDDERAQEYIQQQIRRRIDELGDLINACRDSALIERYENELRVLDSRLVLKEGENFSLDAFLQDIRESRSGGRIINQGDARRHEEMISYVQQQRNMYADRNVIHL